MTCSGFLGFFLRKRFCILRGFRVSFLVSEEFRKDWKRVGRRRDVVLLSFLFCELVQFLFCRENQV